MIMKNTYSLERLFRYAEQLTNTPAGVVTPERFLIAVIDLIEGKLELEEYTPMLCINLHNILGQDLDLAETRERLLFYTKYTQSDSHYNELCMKKYMAVTTAEAVQNKASEIRPELLVRMIMDDPSDSVKICLSSLYDTRSNSMYSL